MGRGVAALADSIDQRPQISALEGPLLLVHPGQAGNGRHHIDEGGQRITLLAFREQFRVADDQRDPNCLLIDIKYLLAQPAVGKPHLPVIRDKDNHRIMPKRLARSVVETARLQGIDYLAKIRIRLLLQPGVEIDIRLLLVLGVQVAQPRGAVQPIQELHLGRRFVIIRQVFVNRRGQADVSDGVQIGQGVAAGLPFGDLRIGQHIVGIDQRHHQRKRLLQRRGLYKG